MQMKILIENMEFYSIIGVYHHERKIKQKIVMDVEAVYDFQGKYLDYQELANFCVKFISEGKFASIEEGLISLSKEIKDKYKNVKKIKLRLKKPTILSFADVGVEFES